MSSISGIGTNEGLGSRSVGLMGQKPQSSTETTGSVAEANKNLFDKPDSNKTNNVQSSVPGSAASFCVLG